MRNTPYKRSEQRVTIPRPAPRSLRYPCRGYWVSVTDEKGRFTRRVWKRLTRRVCKKEYIWPSVLSRFKTRDAEIRQSIQMQPLFLADYAGVELMAAGPLTTYTNRRISKELDNE